MSHNEIIVLSKSQAKKYSYKENDKPYIIISITDIQSSQVVFNDNQYLKDVLHLNFDDIDDESINSISVTDVKKIIEFVMKWKDKVDLIIVHCEAGISRSAGVCASLMLWLNGDDSPIFDNKFYKPNMRCYRMMLDELIKMDLIGEHICFN